MLHCYLPIFRGFFFLPLSEGLYSVTQTRTNKQTKWPDFENVKFHHHADSEPEELRGAAVSFTSQTLPQTNQYS